jgi:hypothetical protein
LALPDLPDLPDRREIRALRAPLVQQVSLGRQGQSDLLDLPDRRVMRAPQGRSAPLVPRAIPALPGLLERLVPREIRGPSDLRAKLAQSDRPVRRDRKVSKVLKVLKATPARPAPRAPRAIPV